MILKNCRVLDGGKLIAAHILLEDKKISKISISSIKSGDADGMIINVKNKLVIPGVIDSHVHFRDLGQEYKEDFFTGSKAAAAGGVTTILDMPNNKVPITTISLLEQKRQAAKKSIVNYGFHFGASPDNEKEIMKAKNAAGIKVYMGSTTGNLLVSRQEDIKKIFDASNKIKKRVIVHAEDENCMNEYKKKFQSKGKESQTSVIHSRTRPNICAEKAAQIAIDLAKQSNSKLHIAHLSTKEELELVRKSKKSKEDISISCEVTPHHLLLNEKVLKKLGNFGKINPPLRTLQDQQSLWEGINDGLIDIIATDHSPHTREEKEKNYWDAPSGFPGVQTMLPLMLNEVNKGNLNLIQLVELCCENPSLLFGIKNKGFIKKGFDADLTVIDIDLKKKIRNEDQFTKVGWTPYNGLEVKGFPIMTINLGKIIHDIDSGIIGNRGDGREVDYNA